MKYMQSRTYHAKSINTPRLLPSLVLIFAACVPLLGVDATFNWQPNSEPDLAGYRLYRLTANGTPPTIVNVGKVTTYTITALPPDRSYDFQLTAYSNTGLESDRTPIVTITVPPEAPPPAPAPLTREAQFTWQANGEPDLAGYRLYCRRQDQPSTVATPLGKVISCTVSNLAVGHTYEFYLTAYTSAGQESDPSAVIVLNTTTTTPTTHDVPSNNTNSTSTPPITPDGGDESPNQDPDPTSPAQDPLDVYVVDDDDRDHVEWSGNWAVSSSQPVFHGVGYRHDRNTSKGNSWALYRADLAASGTYEVAVFYTSGSNRAKNVPYQIIHAGGQNTAVVNQTINGGQWISLGAFEFAAQTPAQVRIGTGGTFGYVIADAVRFSRLPNATALAANSASATLSRLDVSPFNPQSGSFQVSWPTRVGTTYELYQAHQLHGEWTVVLSLPGTGEPVTATVPTDNPSGLLRLLSFPTSSAPALDLE